MDIAIAEPRVETAAPRGKPLLRGIHHLALVTGDMRMTLDFYVRVLGMPLVHGLRTPSSPPSAVPGHGVGSPPHKNIFHYFLDMGGGDPTPCPGTALGGDEGVRKPCT